MSLASKDMHFPPGNVLSVIFEWIYLAVLVTCFILALGNTPTGSKKLYMSMVIWWAIIMVYVMYPICDTTLTGPDTSCSLLFGSL